MLFDTIQLCDQVFLFRNLLFYCTMPHVLQVSMMWNWLQKYHSRTGLIYLVSLKMNSVNILFCLFRCLQQTPGFSFAPRPSECLPVGFPAHIPGTCHFLLGYQHPDLPAEKASLSEHVEAGVRDLGIFSTQQP